jgi:hypothetical protein
VLLAFVGSDGAIDRAQSVTVSGAGLTWTLVRRADVQRGTAEIWRAPAASQLSNVTVKSQQKNGTFDQSLTVVAFANSGGVGASATAGAATGAPSISITTTKAASLVYAVGNDWDRALARTLGGNQVMVHQWADVAAGDTFWVQSVDGVLATADTVALLNDTAATIDRWNFAVVEIFVK